ncbi:MAG: DUF1080 domain-containing protein [Imperialibacter sp.]|uniref:3-keto-disaccharide hydrolase n=1 Tax=Imperialibacter sp. TaxID=2038411 RepID=UPI0032EABCC1
MKVRLPTSTIFPALVIIFSCTSPSPTLLFDGSTLTGWEGDAKTWRVENGAIEGGSLTETVPHNEFLCTLQPYGDFKLTLKYKLETAGGFTNAGVQFRSVRATEPSYEMIGYQADIGNGYFGSLYDESRRDKVLAGIDSLAGVQLFKPDEWNDYQIIAEGKRIQIFLNGVQTVDYTEADGAIQQVGLIGLQVHGGGKVKVSYKDIELTEL